MIITCKKCHTKFNLDEKLLKQAGSKVRCSKCQNIFLAYLPTEKAPFETEKEDFYLSSLGLEMEPKLEVEELPKLKLDTEPVAEETPEETEAVLEIREEELDLSDIEEETPETETVVKEEPEDIELELDLDTEHLAEQTPEEAKASLEPDDDEIEWSALNLKEDQGTEAEIKEVPEELEFELDAESEAKEALDELKQEFELEDIDKKEVTGTVDLGHKADQTEKEKAEKPTKTYVKTKEAPITTEYETMPAGKKRISTPILIALIIALFMGGSYGTYVALKSMNIKIPFISDLLEPAVHDEVGNLKIIAFDITDQFIDNPKSGKLFIISGKVKNEYSEARSFIRVTGKLYTDERVLSKTATTYCGNVLSDQDLLNMDMDSINKRLLIPFGDNKSNVNVKPGKLLQFMIVFPDIPDTTKEYTLEVAGSSPA